LQVVFQHDERTKEKEITLYSRKMKSLFQTDANNEICIALAARLRIASSAMNTFMKARKTPKCTIWRVLQSKESLKLSPFQEQRSLLPI
jgi:hypothetical protein